jgi:transcriptional regulator with XRE-family HTH domain
MVKRENSNKRRTKKDNVGMNIMEARLELGMSQAELARQVGFNHSQTISRIESGKRFVRMRELEAFCRIFKRDPSSFISTSPRPSEDVLWVPRRLENAKFLEGRFLSDCRAYRQVEETVFRIQPIQKSWAYREFPNSELEAFYFGEWMARDLSLGSRPAKGLAWALEEEYGIKVLHDPNLSGCFAVSRGGFGRAILLGDGDPLEQRVYLIAKALFYLVAWDYVNLSAMEQGDGTAEAIAKKSVRFAQGLLVPTDPLLMFWRRRGGLWRANVKPKRAMTLAVVEAARHFIVPIEPIVEALEAIGVVKGAAARKLKLEASHEWASLTGGSGTLHDGPKPTRFSPRHGFLVLIAKQGTRQGRLGQEKAPVRPSRASRSRTEKREKRSPGERTGAG